MTSIEQLLEIMRRLRDPEAGCPWDRQQTYRSLVPFTLEEAYEVADAIERDDLEHLPDELGDLLFQVVFYASIGEEEGRFDFNDVTRCISNKLIRRHPHVFAEAKFESVEAQTHAWEELKRQEREQNQKQDRVLDGISQALPSLTRALKLQRRAARVGFDWPDVDGVFNKVFEELDELRTECDGDRNPASLAEEAGDLLFAVVNLARHLAIDPETALRHANAKFERRFRQVEVALAGTGGVENASLEEMDAAWDAVKVAEKATDSTN